MVSGIAKGGSVSNESAIANLLYRYAELVDSGRFEDLPIELFAHARLVVAPPPARPLDGHAFATLMVRTTIRYGDGTPRTRHLITNPIIEVDEERGTAACRSCYTVLQEVPGEGGPSRIEPIVAGRYHDRFERVDGRWRFTERDYTLVDMVGDVTRHLRIGLPRADPSDYDAGGSST